MRVGGNFETLKENINFILEEKIKQGKLKPKIELQFLVSKINENEKDEFKKIAKDLGLNYCFKTLGIPTWVYDKEFCRKLSDKYLTDTTSRYKSGKLKRNVKCSNAERSVILANGKISICCYDLNGEFNIGDIKKNSFAEIWNNKRYKKIRRLMAERKLPICKTCGETTDLYE
jgi:radical SAM protein with 4Fe4S-binding SPASM domain